MVLRLSLQVTENERLLHNLSYKRVAIIISKAPPMVRWPICARQTCGMPSAPMRFASTRDVRERVLPTPSPLRRVSRDTATATARTHMTARLAVLQKLRR